jgi:hypothetical protein
MLRGTIIPALAMLGLFLSGCTGSTEFSVTGEFYGVSTTANQQYSAIYTADVSDTDHADKVKSLELVGIDATLTRATSLPMTGSGAIWIGPSGSTSTTSAGVVQVGSWPTHTSSAVPDSIAVTLGSGSLSVIEDALKGNGIFVVFLTGTTTTSQNFDANVVLHVKLTYNII